MRDGAEYPTFKPARWGLVFIASASIDLDSDSFVPVLELQAIRPRPKKTMKERNMNPARYETSNS